MEVKTLKIPIHYPSGSGLSRDDVVVGEQPRENRDRSGATAGGDLFLCPCCGRHIISGSETPSYLLFIRHK